MLKPCEKPLFVRRAFRGSHDSDWLIDKGVADIIYIIIILLVLFPTVCFIARLLQRVMTTKMISGLVIWLTNPTTLILILMMSTSRTIRPMTNRFTDLAFQFTIYFRFSYFEILFNFLCRSGAAEIERSSDHYIDFYDGRP